MKTAILLPSTVACCYMLVSFISWFYSFVWSDASEWILPDNYKDYEAVHLSAGACLPCCLLSVPLLPTPEVSFLLFIWSPFCSSCGIWLLQNIKKPTGRSDPPLGRICLAGRVKVSILKVWMTYIALLPVELISCCPCLPAWCCSYLFAV